MDDFEFNRKSLDLDDIPEERPSKSGEESNRLDSGLGEWDSESSRKTSVSSQGSRLSPDEAADKVHHHITKDPKPVVKDLARRRRSGVDMLHSRPSRGSIIDSPAQHPSIVMTHLPRIPKSNRSSGVWSRKISAAGLEFLKMDDEMEEVLRHGKVVMVPRKISDHIPTVPIHSTDRFIAFETNENLGLEDEDLQLYKTPHTEKYELHRHRWEFFGKRDFRKMMILALDGDEWMSGQQKFDLMKTLLSEKDQRKMEKMLKMGYSHDDVVNHFMEEAEKKSGNKDLRKRMEAAMIDAKDMSDDEMVEEMKKQLGSESLKEMEKLIREGHDVKEVMKKMMEVGRTKEEEIADSAETLKHLVKSKKKNIKLTNEEINAMVEERFDDKSKAKLKKLVESGMSMQDALTQVLEDNKPGENLSEMEKKMRSMTNGQILSQYQMYEMMKDQLDEESAKKMEEMIKNGCPLDEAMEYFMKKGKTKEQAQNEKSEKIRAMVSGNKDMSEQEILDMMRSELGAEDKKQLERMLKNGCSMQEVIDHFMNRGKQEEEQNELGKTEFQRNIEAMLEGKNLSDEEILALMRGQLDDKGKEEVKEMLAKGYSPKDIINYLYKNTKTEEEKIKENEKKLARLFDDNAICDEEKIAMLEKQLSSKDKQQMEKMLQKGCSIEEVIAHFMSRSKSPPKEDSEFAKKMHRLSQGKELSEEDMLKLISDNLDKESKEKMDEMLAKGYSKQDVIDHFMRNAKTTEEQMKETADKIKALMSDNSMTDADKLEILRNQLSKEDLAQMETLLKDGGSVDDVMNQILKSKSSESIAETELSKAVNLLVDGRQLDKTEIMDIIRGQIDGDSQIKLDEMIKSGMDPQDIIDYFLNNGKTVKQVRRDVSIKIQALFTDIPDIKEMKIELIKNALCSSDLNQLETMLKRGCSEEEIIALFVNRGMLKDKTVSELSSRIKKLSGGKPLPADQMMALIKSQLGEEGLKEMQVMLNKGYNAHDIVEHFLKKGRTKEEEKNMIQIGINLSKLIDIKNMSKEDILNIMNEHLNDQDKELMEQMLKEGKTLQDVFQHFVARGEKCNSANEDFAQKIRKLSAGRKLSSEEMMELIKDNLIGAAREEMERMIAEGRTSDDIIKKFVGPTAAAECQHRELSLKLESMDLDNMTEEQILSVLNENLTESDKREMEFMLQRGCSLEEVVAYFKYRGVEIEPCSELAKRVKKLSHGKNLSPDEMLQLMKDQLSPDGKAKMEEMLESGMALQDVIDHFMINGKTEVEEQRDIAQKLGKLIQKRKLSKEEVKEMLDQELGKEDKAKMEEMLLHGCSIEDILQHFLLRGVPPEQGKTQLAQRVKKISKGKGLSKKEIIEIIRTQLTQESQEMLDQMLVKGYNQDDVITHFMIKGKTWEEEFMETAIKLTKIIDSEKMTEEEILNAIRENVGAYDIAQLEEMLRRGCTTPEILSLFMNRGNGRAKKTEFLLKIESLIEGKCLHPWDLLELIKEHVDDDTCEEIEILLKKGYAVQDAIEYSFIHGKTHEQKQREVAEKMVQLLNTNMKDEDIIALMKKQLGKAGNRALEEMLARGCSLGDIIDSFLDKNSGMEVEEDTEFAKKIKDLMGDKVLNADEMISLIRSQLDMGTQMQMDEMLRNGCSKDETIQHFMTRERNKKGQKKNEFGRKIFELTRGTKLTKRELILLMKNHLDTESAQKMEDMIKKCYPMEDIIDYFLKNGKTPEQALREKALQKEMIKKEASRKIRKMIAGNDLSNEEILAILKLQMGEDDKQQLDLMLKRGCTAQEIIDHFVNRDVSDDEGEQTMFEKKISEMMKGKDLSHDEIIELMRSELDDESVKHLDEMLKKGYTQEDIIKYFMKHGDDRNDFVQEMKKMIDSDNMTKEEILDVMRNKLGVLDQRKMDDMLREGYSLEEVIQHLMAHGKTQEQETLHFTRRMSLLLADDSPLTDKEKVEKLKENLGKEAASMLEELLKNGLTSGHVLDLFMKHGNNVNSLVKDDFFQREMKFPDEPSDADMHANRNVFTVIDQAKSKESIPWMSPSGKNHIFGLFFEKVLEVIDGYELTHREILDLMRSRMGAGYAKEFDELRSKGMSLQQIVDYFLQRDAETIAESRLVAKLKADARVDSRVYLKRKYTKEKWGVSLNYTYSKNHGLHLIMNDVMENGPAWESGVRPGDVIVTINDWLIVLMDRPQVAAHLFQAGANIVKLGIQKSRGTSPDRYLGIY